MNFVLKFVVSKWDWKKSYSQLKRKRKEKKKRNQEKTQVLFQMRALQKVPGKWNQMADLFRCRKF